eukprot:scaffold4124_cov109-Isochrysis_galbana.AAC.4
MINKDAPPSPRPHPPPPPPPPTSGDALRPRGSTPNNKTPRARGGSRWRLASSGRSPSRLIWARTKVSNEYLADAHHGVDEVGELHAHVRVAGRFAWLCRLRVSAMVGSCQHGAVALFTVLSLTAAIVVVLRLCGSSLTVRSPEPRLWQALAGSLDRCTVVSGWLSGIAGANK